jgi:hypothetical protein
MISKVLEKTLYQIEEYQRRYPDHYKDASEDIEGLKVVIAAMLEKMKSGPDHYLIDPLISKLIEDLNDAGYDTFSSCQGKRCIEDFECDSHCDYAFISFCRLPHCIKQKARELGLIVYNRGLSISSQQEKRAAQSYISDNLIFEDKIRLLFGLPSRPVERLDEEKPTAEC